MQALEVKQKSNGHIDIYYYKSFMGTFEPSNGHWKPVTIKSDEEEFVKCLDGMGEQAAKNFFFHYLEGKGAFSITLKDLASSLDINLKTEVPTLIDNGVRLKIFQKYYTYWKIFKQAKLKLYFLLQDRFIKSTKSVFVPPIEENLPVEDRIGKAISKIKKPIEVKPKPKKVGKRKK